MVSIFTYRDERKLFAVIGAVIIAALLALLQLNFSRSGRTSPLTTVITTVSAWAQLAAATVVNGTRGAFETVAHTPALTTDNAKLRERVASLERENRALSESLSRAPGEAALTRAQAAAPEGIPATVIGFDPENVQRIVTIDRGAKDHVQRDNGVMTGDGVVGTVIEVSPLSSKVLLIDDPTSRLPALVQRGRWWAIATGTSTRVKLRYISQDAKLLIGDPVVTGEGRSFHAGVLVGHISALEPVAAGGLDQSATVNPAVDLSAIHRVLVVPK